MGKGKAEVGSRKWLANKMKAAGLQKLRWYCQMCEKQCRDENGFKVCIFTYAQRDDVYFMYIWMYVYVCIFMSICICAVPQDV